MNASLKFATASTSMLWSSFNVSVKLRSSIFTAGAEELLTAGAELEETKGVELEDITTTGAELEDTTTGAELEDTTTGAELEDTTTGVELEDTTTGVELSELSAAGQPYSPGWWSQMAGSISNGCSLPIQPARVSDNIPRVGIDKIFIVFLTEGWSKTIR